MGVLKELILCGHKQKAGNTSSTADQAAGLNFPGDHNGFVAAGFPVWNVNDQCRDCLPCISNAKLEKAYPDGGLTTLQWNTAIDKIVKPIMKDNDRRRRRRR